MIWVIAALLVLLLIVTCALWIMWHRPIQTTGSPTDESAKVDAKAAPEIAKIEQSAQEQIAEVKGADRKKLFDLARLRIGKLRK